MKSIRSLLLVPLASGSRGCRREEVRGFVGTLASALEAGLSAEVVGADNTKGFVC